MTAQRIECKYALYEVEALEKHIDIQNQRDTYHCMLRSTTQWHEKGKQNNKYFFRAIKERQTQQISEALRCSSTGAVLQKTPDILQGFHSFYQNLYTLIENIPNDVKLTPSHVATLTLASSDSDAVNFLQYAPLGKVPGLDVILFEVYKLLSEIFLPFRRLLLVAIRYAFVGIIPPSWQRTRMILLF